jgi:hypothetical protein
MIGREYFARQAATLLRLALLTKDAKRAATLAAKAADLQDRLDAVPPATDVSPIPPDVEVRDQARAGTTVEHWKSVGS